MDSLTLTSVYTYAMITICADSWNSRSVLWPMMFFDVFWGSKVSLGHKPSIPSYTLESEIRSKDTHQTESLSRC